MLEIQVPASREHDMAHANELLMALGDLYTFEQIAVWDKNATAEAERIQGTLAEIQGKQQALSQAIQQEQRDHAAKGFLSRLFASRQERKRFLDELARLAKESARLQSFLSEFQTTIDFTPNSPADLKDMLTEFKQRRKELQIEKRGLDSQMAGIRVEARRKTTYTDPGKPGAWSRRQIRLEKEAALGPHETEKAGLLRQIVYLDRMIAWLERFKSAG